MAVLQTYRMQIWRGALCATLWSLLPVAAGAAWSAPAAPTPPAESQPLAPRRVELPDTPAFRGKVDLEADEWTIQEIVEHLHERHELPVEIAAGTDVGGARLTLRLHDKSVESVLTLIVEALGEGYRWTRQGEGVVLQRRAVGWLASLPEGVAEELAGPAARPAGAASAFGTPAPLPRLAALGDTLAREIAVLGDVHRDVEACASLMATTFGTQAEGGIPVSALPAPLQQQVFLLTLRWRRSSHLTIAAGSVKELVANPLVNGTGPRQVYLERSHGNWILFYGADTRSSRGFSLPPP